MADRASASGAEDCDLIPNQVKSGTSILVITASLLDAQHQRNSVENKPDKFTGCVAGKN